MKTGDLVIYKRQRKDNRFSYQVGLVVGRCPVIKYDEYLVVQWSSGAKFAEHRRFLKLVKN
jgi:hypothetical protein|tara:strand:- start:1611 stop:1793 length:183 start_codon:yes stop_codon:yes gene_type:complete